MNALPLARRPRGARGGDRRSRARRLDRRRPRVGEARRRRSGRRSGATRTLFIAPARSSCARAPARAQARASRASRAHGAGGRGWASLSGARGVRRWARPPTPSARAAHQRPLFAGRAARAVESRRLRGARRGATCCATASAGAGTAARAWSRLAGGCAQRRQRRDEPAALAAFAADWRRRVGAAVRRARGARAALRRRGARAGRDRAASTCAASASSTARPGRARSSSRRRCARSWRCSMRPAHGSPASPCPTSRTSPRSARRRARTRRPGCISWRPRSPVVVIVAAPAAGAGDGGSRALSRARICSPTSPTRTSSGCCAASMRGPLRGRGGALQLQRCRRAAQPLAQRCSRRALGGDVECRLAPAGGLWRRGCAVPRPPTPGTPLVALFNATATPEREAHGRFLARSPPRAARWWQSSTRPRSTRASDATRRDGDARRATVARLAAEHAPHAGLRRPRASRLRRRRKPRSRLR